ncbi:unnamed protein product [Adineta steineri]|uniref:Uncharacterized protein n=1 Tax=Adineta steineri TaxID=433720 RepID=A0A818J270_9BILA|nr:unnamed protein product [Adineta steineri]CAF3532133.1 unnamed protein product [Adineta steineri]
MYIYYLILSFICYIKYITTNQIEIDIPSISSSHTFELSSNTSQFLNRDVLFGLVDDTSASIPSSIHVRASYEQIQIERFFNLYESTNNKQQQQNQQQIKKEPIFRSYLLAPSFNRSYPFIRVLIASVQGSYENIQMQPMCAIVTAVNEQNLYETQACFISPTTGHCLVTLPVLKMVEYANKNQTANKIELYLKLHHVATINECISDHTPKQGHIHQETRIGHAEYIDNDNIIFSTITRSSILVDYPSGIHYPNWYFPLKLKLILSSTNYSSFIIRCRLTPYFTINSIQTNILKISNYFIQINQTVLNRQSITDIDFNITINQTNKLHEHNLIEIDLATILLTINSTYLYKNTNQYNSNSILFIDWFILLNNSVDYKEPIFRVPIHVQYDNIQTIVAITDFTSLINIAMLSMQIQQFPIKILAVNYSGSVQSISKAVCHSENIYLIQVDSNCNHVYFSGHERDDFFDHINSPTSIIIRYEKFLQRLHFTIYIPERPLRIELSDTKLSRINGWFVTNRDDDEQKIESSTNGLDDDDIDDDEDDDDDDDDEDIKCYPVYQQSLIHVYTKFYRTTQNGDRIYLFNKYNVLITPFIRGHLETDNIRVAIIKNGRLIGIGPGKTNVRIYSFANKLPMGSKTVYVDDQELIRIHSISFNLLTNIDLQTNFIEHIDPIYKIHFQVKPIFNRFNIDNKNQFGQVNVILTYSDNTSISLDEILSDYYQFEIDVTRSNPLLIRFDSFTSWKNVHVFPIALGHTTLHARLKLGQQQCTDDRSFSQNDLSCEITITSINNNNNNNNNPHSPTHHQTDHFVILNNNNDQRIKTSPFLIALSILLGACIVLVIAFLIHWFIHFYYQRKSTGHIRRQRHSTQSGAEEANHDWIFLDRNSLEMPIKPQPQPQQQQQQQNSPSVHSSSLHITSNPLLHTSSLQRQKELSELSHSQMIAYFDNLKESHA